MMGRRVLSAAVLLIPLTALAGEPVDLLSEDFSGPLHGKNPAVHPHLTVPPWSADGIFEEDGWINDGNNTDRGAFVDLGEDFSFQPGATYTLTLSWRDLSNAVLFAGFSPDPPNPGAQMQTQGTNFALRARRIDAGLDNLATWTRFNGANSGVEGTVPTPDAGSATLTLNVNQLTDASFTVDGCGAVAVDLTAGYRYLWIGYEDPTSGESDVRFTGLVFRGPAPPQTGLLSEDFAGDLQGKQPVTHENLPASPWTADGIFTTNGHVNDGSDTDRGAVVDLGPNFEFLPDSTYTLELGWEGLSNAILFAGFSTSLPNTGAQMQTQGTNFGLRARRIDAGTDKLATWKRSGGTNSAGDGGTATPFTGGATLTLQTKSLTDATFTVDGATTGIDLSAGYRYLWIAYEDPTSGVSSAKFSNLVLRGPVPPAPPQPALVTIEPESRLIDAGTAVSLSADPPDAVIHYTIDGSEPDAGSPVYSAPFTLSASATVKAVGVRDGVPGPVAVKSYTVRVSIGTPNLLLVVGRGVGSGDLHCCGGVNIDTPALDGLAREGVRFTQYTTTGPGAAASQFGLLSGRVAARSGMEGGVVPKGANGWQAEEWTLAEALRKGGYETAFIGEWLLGDAEGSHPNDQGFECFYGLPSDVSTDPPLSANREVLEETPDPALLLDQLTLRAEEYIGSSAAPFALVFQAPALSAGGDSPAGSHGNRIEALDRSVGRLLAALEARGVSGETLVVFVSDGGAPRAEDGGSNAVLRDGAGSTWEGGLRGPMIARLPGKLPAGQMNLSLLWQPDVFPTLAGLLNCGLAADRPLDGTPRPDVLLGQNTRPAGDETAFGFRFEEGRWKLCTAREGKWKTHLSVVNKDPENKMPTTAGQLFDLHVNAEESINRAAGQSAVVQRLQELADGFAAGLPGTGSSDLPAPKPAVTDGVATTLDGGGAVGFSFSRPVDSLDDFYLIEHSADLMRWHGLPIGPYVVERESGAGFVESLVLRVPLGVEPLDGPRRFVRLRASRPANR